MGLNMTLLYLLSPKIEVDSKDQENKLEFKKPTIVLVSGLFVLGILSMWKINFFLSLIIVIISFACAFLIYKTVLED